MLALYAGPLRHTTGATDGAADATGASEWSPKLLHWALISQAQHQLTHACDAAAIPRVAKVAKAACPGIHSQEIKNMRAENL
jgi:hypothetical protein